MKCCNYGPIFETNYLDENVKNGLSKKVAKNVSIFGYIFKYKLLAPSKNSPKEKMLPNLVTLLDT